MDLKDIFGVNVEEQFLAWFHGEFTEKFHKRFPEAEGLTLLILNPETWIDSVQYHYSPADEILVEAVIGDQDKASADGGTNQNVLGKLRFVLRTTQDSRLAEDELVYLLQPGDFPYEGAGEHRHFFGGVSGLAKEDDWRVFCECVDKLIELLMPVCQAARERAEQMRKDESLAQNVRNEAKYLRGIDVSDLFAAESTWEEPSPLN